MDGAAHFAVRTECHILHPASCIVHFRRPFSTLCREIIELRHSIRKQMSVMRGIRAYVSSPWNLLDWVQSAGLFAAAVSWLTIVLDTSRDIDLQTDDFVDLEQVGGVYHLCVRWRIYFSHQSRMPCPSLTSS